MDQPQDSAGQPSWLRSATGIRTMRMRLRFALVTMAVVPISLVLALAGTTLNALISGNSIPAEPVVLMVALSCLLVVVAIWLSRQVLRPAEELEKSRAELVQLYE